MSAPGNSCASKAVPASAAESRNIARRVVCFGRSVCSCRVVSFCKKSTFRSAALSISSFPLCPTRFRNIPHFALPTRQKLKLHPQLPSFHNDPNNGAAWVCSLPLELAVPVRRFQVFHVLQVTSHKSHPRWAIICGSDYVSSSQARAHQRRAVQHVSGQGDYEARLRQSARSGGHPQHPQSRKWPWALDLRTEVPRVRPSLRRQRQLHPQPQMTQVPGRPAGTSPLAPPHPTLSRGFMFRRIQIRQAYCPPSHRRPHHTHLVYETDVRRVRQFPEQRGADSAQSKGQPEESSRNRAHFCG